MSRKPYSLASLSAHHRFVLGNYLSYSLDFFKNDFTWLETRQILLFMVLFISQKNLIAPLFCLSVTGSYSEAFWITGLIYLFIYIFYIKLITSVLFKIPKFWKLYIILIKWFRSFSNLKHILKLSKYLKEPKVPWYLAYRNWICYHYKAEISAWVWW